MKVEEAGASEKVKTLNHRKARSGFGQNLKEKS